jgi:hypothetical protein
MLPSTLNEVPNTSTKKQGITGWNRKNKNNQVLSFSNMCFASDMA